LSVTSQESRKAAYSATKARMMCLSGVQGFRPYGLVVLTHHSATDGQTDRRMDRHLATAWYIALRTILWRR